MKGCANGANDSSEIMMNYDELLLDVILDTGILRFDLD